MSVEEEVERSEDGAPYREPGQTVRRKTRGQAPAIARDVPVRGVIFDVETGLLREAQQVAHQMAT
jgi:hypothetical protein